MNNIKAGYLREICDYLWISIGTALVAIAVCEYLIPCRIVTGSVSGLALLISEISSLSDSLIVLILNIVCLLIGTCALGKKFGIRSVYVSLLLPLLIEILPGILKGLTLKSDDILINILLFLGFLTCGQCILFEKDTASGGLDTIAEVIARITGNPLGIMVALSGMAVCVLNIGVYGIRNALLGAAVTMANGILLHLFTLLKKIPLYHHDPLYQR
ncbi:MAG: YitT family protein [Oscillospiraceae bacterium]|nr:YitT family protein [Oscillospiraceae bacterium]MBQ6493268.1 YitT family protein [Erysipelotrichaceae bacterium]